MVVRGEAEHAVSSSSSARDKEKKSEQELQRGKMNDYTLAIVRFAFIFTLFLMLFWTSLLRGRHARPRVCVCVYVLLIGI